jgi:hypothetical protein
MPLYGAGCSTLFRRLLGSRQINIHSPHLWEMWRMWTRMRTRRKPRNRVEQWNTLGRNRRPSRLPIFHASRRGWRARQSVRRAPPFSLWRRTPTGQKTTVVCSRKQPVWFCSGLLRKTGRPAASVYAFRFGTQERPAEPQLLDPITEIMGPPRGPSANTRSCEPGPRRFAPTGDRFALERVIDLRRNR